jgi:hypothetical protein
MSKHISFENRTLMDQSVTEINYTEETPAPAVTVEQVNIVIMQMNIESIRMRSLNPTPENRSINCERRIIEEQVPDERIRTAAGLEIDQALPSESLVNPFEGYPAELLYMIFRKLDHKALISLQLTNSELCGFIKNNPVLFNDCLFDLAFKWLLQIVTRMTDVDVKNKLFFEIVSRQASIRPQVALSVAQMISHSDEVANSADLSSQALNTLVSVLSLTDIEQAQAIAGQIKSKFWQTCAYKQIVQVQARVDFGQAMATVDLIEDDVDKAKAIGKVARSLTPEDYQLVLRKAESLNDPKSKDKLLSKVMASQVQNTLEQTLVDADLIEDEDLKNKALVDIYLKCPSQNVEELEEYLNKALLISNNIEDEVLKDHALYAIAVRQALNNPDQSLETVDLILDEDIKNDALEWICVELAPNNPEFAFKCVDLIEDRDRRFKVAEKVMKVNPGLALEMVPLLEFIDHPLIYGMFAESQALIKPEDAIKMACFIQDPVKKVSCLCNIVSAQYSVILEQAQDTIRQVFLIVDDIENQPLKDIALRNIVGIQVMFDTNAALQTANLIGSDVNKIEAFCMVATNQLATDVEQAYELFRRSLTLTHSVQNDHTKALLLNLIIWCLPVRKSVSMTDMSDD